MSHIVSFPDYVSRKVTENTTCANRRQTDRKGRAGVAAPFHSLLCCLTLVRKTVLLTEMELPYS